MKREASERLGLSLIMAVYLMLTLVTVASWNSQQIYRATGDEPHYLVIADALVADGTADVTRSYIREFQAPTFYPYGLTDAEVIASVDDLVPPEAHVVATPSGTFSWHGVGLSAMAIPLVLLVPGDVMALRLMSSLVGLLVLALLWRVSAACGWTGWPRVMAVGAVGVAYPVLTASTQLFPDLWAGAFLLAAITWLMTPRLQESWPATLLVAAGIGWTPWLGMRFAIPAALASIGVALVAFRRSRARGVLVVVPVAILALGLASFHVSAFGTPLGPPTEGTLEFGSNFAMLLPGLLLDQDQGFLFFHPLLWLGIAGIPLLWRANRGAFVVWLGVVLSLWIPAAAHPGLYGLGGFFGRYSWSLSVMMMVPTLLLLQLLWLRNRVLAVAAVTVGIAFQAYIWILGTFVGGTYPGGPPAWDLYTRPGDTWIESYAAWWFPLQNFFPALYDAEWAARFAPNAVWIVIAFAAIAGGYWWTRPSGRLPSRASRGVLLTSGCALVILILAAGLASEPGPRMITLQQSAQGTASVDREGYLTNGPELLMRWGPYTWWVEYQAGGSDTVGRWELVRLTDAQVVAAGELRGTQDTVDRVVATVPYRSYEPQPYLLRVAWYGTASMRVHETGVRHGR